MYSFELDPESPNQQFSTIADGINFEITLNTANNLLFATIKANGKTLKESGRCIGNQWLIPYMAYAPEGCGNFKFITINDEYPNYKNFNASCILMYYTNEELINAK